MNPLIQSKDTTILSVLIALTLGCFAFLPETQAACLDGCNNGLFNVWQGDDALLNDTTGAGNTAFGWRVLSATTDGSFNTGIGGGALLLNNGSSNTAIGAAALLLNTTGIFNTAAGTDAMVSNDTGSWNVAFGGYALPSNVDGDLNSAFGEAALGGNVSGMNNTAIGADALFNNDYLGAGLANFNTAVGADALEGNLDGAANTAIGDFAFADNASGSNNTVVGWQAGLGVEGSDNIYIGATSGPLGGGSESGTIRIGDPNFVSACFVAGITGVSVTGDTVVVNGDGQLGTAAAGSPLSMNEVLKERKMVQQLKATTEEQRQVVQQLKATTEEQATTIALQEGQIQI